MSDRLTADQVETAASLLLAARRDLETIPDIPTEVRPNRLDDAYDIQDALHRAGRWDVTVIKVGATSDIARERLGVTQPIVGSVPGSFTFRSGDVIDVGVFHHPPLLECEFGLRLARDVHPGSDVDSDIRGLVDAVVPAMEIVDTRFDDMLGPDGPSLVADNSGSAAAVLADPLPVSPTDDLTEATVTLVCDGDELARGKGEAALGDPFESLRWLLRHQSARSLTVTAGTVVITGTCTGLVPVPIGRPVVAEFGRWGRVEVSFSDDDGRSGAPK